MNTKLLTDNDRRIKREVRIANRIVRDALALGYLISVNDGEEYVVKRSSNARAIKAAMRSTDEDILVFRKADGTRVGSVWLIYGNDRDIISDYSGPSLEPLNALLEPIMDWSDTL